MIDNSTTVNEFKERLKTLRETRKEIIKKNQELLKVQKKETSLIKKELKNRPCTVPELASQTGLKSKKVFYYI